MQKWFSSARKEGLGLLEHLNDEDLIESYEQSIKENLDKDFINFLRLAIKKRGLEKYIKDKQNPKQMINA